MIDLNRRQFTTAANGATLEWLATNGIGGYASGTVSGIHTRRYHGLLVAANPETLNRTLLVSHVDETVTCGGTDYALSSHQWPDGVSPKGFQLLESFLVEGSVAVWVFAFGDSLLEKSIWMEQGSNTTYVRYNVLRGQLPITLAIDAFVSGRGIHETLTESGATVAVHPFDSGLQIDFGSNKQAYIQCADQNGQASFQWYKNFHLERERERGHDHHDERLKVATFSKELVRGQTLTLVCSDEPNAQLDGYAAYLRQIAYEDGVLSTNTIHETKTLRLAARQFMISRKSADDSSPALVTGYHWFDEWARDALIALPGLAQAAEQADFGANLIRRYTRHLKNGLLPDQLPSSDSPNDQSLSYNSVDASLWLFNAVARHMERTADRSLGKELFESLDSVISSFVSGSEHVFVDDDGLLATSETAYERSWMCSRVDGKPVTPRFGKAIEINALWYNALKLMESICQDVDEPNDRFVELSEQVRDSFSKFWDESLDYCYDVIDSLEGNDESLRPNQLLAVSLPHSPLSVVQRKAIVDTCARHLVTPCGLRTLPVFDSRYVGTYVGTQSERDTAAHQGSVWPHLLGAFVEAHLKVYNNPPQARSFLFSIVGQTHDHGLGSISEIFDGDAPHTPRGCIASAPAVGELLRAWQLTESSAGAPRVITPATDYRTSDAIRVQGDPLSEN